MEVRSTDRGAADFRDLGDRAGVAHLERETARALAVVQRMLEEGD